MASVREKERIRYRYGICLNENCPKCKAKDVQEISARKELVCTECGKPLRECPPPKPSANYLKYVIIGIVVVAIAAGACFFSFKKQDASPAKQPDTTEVAQPQPEEKPEAKQADTTEIAQPQPEEKPEEKPVAKPATTATTAKAPPSSGTLRLSYGTYTGATKGGYPHGQGRLTYSTTRQINRNDVKGRTANAGDYVIGEFYNGFVVYGKHYDSAGNLLGSLNFGVGAEDSYDAK